MTGDARFTPGVILCATLARVTKPQPTRENTMNDMNGWITTDTTGFIDGFGEG